MSKTIQINGQKYKADDVYLIGINYPGEHIILFESEDPHTCHFVKLGGSRNNLRDSLAEYHNTLNQNGIYNFALVGDNLVNIEQLIDGEIFLGERSNQSSYVIGADFKCLDGQTILLDETNDKQYAEDVMESFRAQKELYEADCNPIILDSSQQTCEGILSAP